MFVLHLWSETNCKIVRSRWHSFCKFSWIDCFVKKNSFHQFTETPTNYFVISFILIWNFSQCESFYWRILSIVLHFRSLKLKKKMVLSWSCHDESSQSFWLAPTVSFMWRALVSSVSIKSCIKLYTTVEEIWAKELKGHCSQLIIG